jgi:outer membrane lipoprotein SlyB
MRTFIHFTLVALSAATLAACASSYSPNTYSSNAVQLASKVEAGTIIGYREVGIRASGGIFTVAGGAAGGVLGVEYANSGLVAVGATTVGGLLGNALDHAAGDTTGWEYIVRKPSGEMLSVTQREKQPLALGQKVLVIMGPQARVVPDYSVPPAEPVVAAAPAPKEKEPEAQPVKVEVVLSLPPGVSVQPANAPAPLPQAEVEQAVPAARPNPGFPGVDDMLERLGLTPIVARPADQPAAEKPVQEPPDEHSID